MLQCLYSSDMVCAQGVTGTVNACHFHHHDGIVPHEAKIAWPSLAGVSAVCLSCQAWLVVEMNATTKTVGICLQNSLHQTSAACLWQLCGCDVACCPEVFVVQAKA